MTICGDERRWFQEHPGRAWTVSTLPKMHAAKLLIARDCRGAACSPGIARDVRSRPLDIIRVIPTKRFKGTVQSRETASQQPFATDHCRRIWLAVPSPKKDLPSAIYPPFYRPSIVFPLGDPYPPSPSVGSRSTLGQQGLARPPTLRLAGMTLRGSNDRKWFRAHPERSHRCRLATPTELADLRERGCFDGGARLADDYFIHALCRIDQASGNLYRLFVVLRAGTEIDEAQCLAAWFQSEIISGQIERLKQ